MLEEQSPKLEIYKRRLPHWRLAGSIYFVTWRLQQAQSKLEPAERSTVTSVLKHFDEKRYDLLAYVIMHNHIHVLVRPKAGYRLQEIVHSWKSYSAHIVQREFGRQGRIWQDESFDRIVRDEAEFLEKAQYILNNPLRTWPDIEDYPWVYYKEAGTEACPTSS